MASPNSAEFDFLPAGANIEVDEGVYHLPPPTLGGGSEERWPHADCLFDTGLVTTDRPPLSEAQNAMLARMLLEHGFLVKGAK